MLTKKSYTTSENIAKELVKVAGEMGVPESSIVTFALRDFLLKYRKEQQETNQSYSLSSVA